jgi:hypothetical protein
VPSCEFFPVEAVRTNVLGCDNVLDSAIRAGVKKVIVLSTDKAVYPINAMGLSKALSEKVMVSRSRNLNSTGRGTRDERLGTNTAKTPSPRRFYRFTTLPFYRFTTLPPYRFTTLPFYRFTCRPLKFVTRHSVHSYLFPFHSGRRDPVFHLMEGG